MNLPLVSYWQRLLGWDRFAECLRVALALGGIVAWCLIRARMDAVIPALLGAIACALAETDEHWRSRLGSVLLTLGCFALTAFAVQWLLPSPGWFAVLLPLGTFALVMLGAASGRHATIGTATLILAVYTMIGVDAAQAHGSGERQPWLLLAGAAWYALLSLAWSALSPQQAVRQALARLFEALADYLDSKAALFTPVHGVDRQALQLALARRNERVVRALNESRLVLLDRIGMRQPRGATAASLQLYFVAQDIHERISSAHYAYDALAEAFFHSDVLFRCEHLLRLEASACRQRAQALRLHAAPAMRSDGIGDAALEDLGRAVAAVAGSAPHAPSGMRDALQALLGNLRTVHRQLASDRPGLDTSDLALQDPSPRSPTDIWARIRSQLTPQSFRFRHALRLALALLAGFGVLHALHPRNGYWILLTTLLVCQPSYGATHRVLLQRVAGTVAGLVAGWATLRLVPFGPGQLLLVVVTGVLFFAGRQRRYALATAAITLFVVLCFNQIGNGYAVMWPRLLDTLIGAALAAAAIQWVLPDWQGRPLQRVLAQTLRDDARYLRRIVAQYASGKRDDLPYRIARRDAHNADAALSQLLSNMLREPGRHRQGADVLLRFLAAAHALLGHVSALGAHRQALAGHAAQAVTHAGEVTALALEQLADTLAAAGPPGQAPGVSPPSPTPEPDDPVAQLALRQLGLVRDQHARLAALAAEMGHT